MSHEIAKINGKDAMMYQNEMPWHRLGTRLDGEPNVEQAMRAASLDWSVSLEPMYIVPGAPVVSGEHLEVPGRRAVVRSVDNAVLSVVSDKYTPLQNEEAFGVLDTACSEFGVTIESAGALGNGSKVWMLAKLPESTEPVPGDRVDGYFLLTTSHDATRPYIARPTPVRVVCSNTLQVALRAGSDFIRLEHNQKDMQEFKYVETLVTKMVQSLAITGETFGELARKKMTRNTIEMYIDAVLGVPEVDTYLEDLFEMENEIPRNKQILELVYTGRGAEMAGETAWGAYNGVTEYFDHVRTGQAKTPRAQMSANVSAIFGHNARLKERALALAIQA